jgi:hypothetical protein
MRVKKNIGAENVPLRGHEVQQRDILVQEKGHKVQQRDTKSAGKGS